MQNLKFPSKTVNNLFKFSAQDSDLEYLYWRSKKPTVSSGLKPPLVLEKKICSTGSLIETFSKYPYQEVL